MKRTVYKVYEVSKEHAEHGKLVRVFKAKRSADRFSDASIFRYVKPATVLELNLGNPRNI